MFGTTPLQAVVDLPVVCGNVERRLTILPCVVRRVEELMQSQSTPV